ncbi:MAG TPA: Fe-S cluster assembly protein SufD [Chitinophagaceae bacterium]|nr:Fe-S cluster assembly protein SufD [Chitinophagaceae bacterium]
MLTINKEVAPFLLDFEEQQTKVQSSSSGKIATERNKSLDLFYKRGVPTRKYEEWVHTNIKSYLKDNYTLASAFNTLRTDKYKNVANEMLQAIYHAEQEQDFDVYYIVSVNGIWQPGISQLPHPDHMKIKPILDAENEDAFNAYFNQIVDLDKHPFSALNSALFEQGLYFEVPKNSKINKPFHILHIWDIEEPTWFNSRNLFKVSESAQFELIETHKTLQDTNAVLNTVTEVVLDQNAHFRHYEIQNEQKGLVIINALEANQKKDSNYSNYTFTLPSANFVRNNLSIYLDDHHLESHMYGFYLTALKQLVDNHTEVHHKYTHGESNQLYKGVLLDESRGVFNGKIYVYPQAQKTNAFQESANVLYSPKATVNAKPQLEIFADDVKCSHGATMGQMDEEALFYLQARGISKASAKKMMIRAFAFDVTQKIENATLKVYVEQLIDKAMKQYIAD